MEVKYVKRDENMVGHLFFKLGSWQKPIPHDIFLEHLRIPSVKGANPDNPKRASSPVHHVYVVTTDWNTPYMEYLNNHTLLEDKVLKRKIQ
jgi:hypothetical protein